MTIDQKTNPSLDEKDPTLTKEELNARRDEITAFYKDNIQHLEIQAEYEMLLATIEKDQISSEKKEIINLRNKKFVSNCFRFTQRKTSFYQKMNLTLGDAWPRMSLKSLLIISSV